MLLDGLILGKGGSNISKKAKIPCVLLRLRADSRLAANKSKGKRKGHDLCMVEMLRPCKVKRSSRVGRVVTCRKCWVYGAEKGIIKVKCAGKPVPGNCTKRAWWRQREEWPRNVACLLSAWGVEAHQADDVCKYRHSRLFEAALVLQLAWLRFGELAGRLQGC